MCLFSNRNVEFPGEILFFFSLRRIRVGAIAAGILFCSVIFFSDELRASDSVHKELPQAGSDQHKSWKQYGGGPDQSKYLNFEQITKSNVTQLEVAWVYPSG